MARDLRKDIEVINMGALIVGATEMVIVPADIHTEFQESALIEGFSTMDAFKKPGYVVTGGIVDQGNEPFEGLIIELSDKIRAAKSIQDLVEVFFETMVEEEEVK